MSLSELPSHVSRPDPALYWSDNYVVVDFETTTELKGSPLAEGNRIILACWETSDGVDSHTFGSEFEQGALVDACRRADFIVAHNAKFELGWLKRCGIDLRKVVPYCTMVAEHVLGGNRYSLHQLGLDACLKRYGFAPKEGTIGRMFKAGLPTEVMPESWLLKYCKRDVAATHELFLAQREKLRAKSLEAINYQRNLVTPALADIEFNGMQLDEKVVLDMEKEYEDAYAQLNDQFQRFCEGASPGSPVQMREFIYGKLGFRVPTDHIGRPLLTDSGDPSTRADVLDRLKPANARQREFMDLRGRWARLNSDLTKYIRKFAECCREDGGLLYGSFNQCSTRTHRLSSSGTKHKVQFQNFNRDFKPLFRARHADWIIGEADGAQLEFRVAAHLGRDSVALRDIVTGTDIHRYTASIINEVDQADVEGWMRQAAKPDTFKPLYGGYSGTPAQQRYYAAFKEKYAGVAGAQVGWTQEVLDRKFLTTEWGMRYYWPDTYMTQSGYIKNTTSIYNYPVQAFATAEIIPCAIVAAWHRMKDMKGFLVNTVHDSIIAELPPEEIDTWHEIARQCLIHDAYNMIRKLYSVRLTVPLGAGVMIGSHWANKEAKESETVYDAPREEWLEAAQQEEMIDADLRRYLEEQEREAVE
jgi:DNA polymerase I-like protein with 3'-5' exonuclease and polymerase domains